MTKNQKKLEQLLLDKIEKECATFEPQWIAEMAQALLGLWKLDLLGRVDELMNS